jgi:restriction system protein
LIKSRIEWAITYLVHAGLAERPQRGHFRITERGREALKEGADRVDNKYLQQFAEFRDFLARHKSGRKKAERQPQTEKSQLIPITPEWPAPVNRYQSE